MKVGIPKEIKLGENRVALLPSQIAELTKKGHTVIIERGAGENAGFTDEEYTINGAIVSSQDEVYNADIIVKVKCPLTGEYSKLQNDQILFCYLHFDENIPAENIVQIVNTGVTAIAFEWVEEKNDLPLLKPMSKMSGALFARKALDLLLYNKGHLGGNYFKGLTPCRAMIIGIGRQGAVAAGVLARNGVTLTIVDKQPERINSRIQNEWSEWNPDKMLDKIIQFDENNPNSAIEIIKDEVSNIDIILGCAIRRPTLPKNKMRYLIDRECIQKMTKGSVICDTTACNGDLYETCFASEDLLETDTIDGVIHYNCDHIPSLASRSSSIILSQAVFPYIQKLLQGFEEAVRSDSSLAKATMCYKGQLVHKRSAQIKGLNCVDLNELI